MSDSLKCFSCDRPVEELLSFSLNQPSGNSRLILSVCVQTSCPCSFFVCMPAWTFVCSVCVKDSCAFCFLLGPQANSHPACPKCSLLQGISVDCHHPPPLINPSQWQLAQSEMCAAEIYFCFVSVLLNWDSC